MSKRLEQFIRDNREELDDAEPGEHIWEGLKQHWQLPSARKKIVTIGFLKWSVAAVVLISAGIGFFYYSGSQRGSLDPQQQAIANKNDLYNLLKEVDPGRTEEMYHFARLIELRQEELKRNSKEHPDLYKKFVDDVNKLDSAYVMLKKEWASNGNSEQLLEAMILNLRLQTELLNQQLQIIKQVNQSKNYGDENKNI